MYDWADYYNHVGNKPNLLVERTLPFVLGRHAALDLGSGNFRDSVFLLAQGFRDVVAVDSYEYVRASVPKGIEFVWSPLERYTPEPATYDLAICCNSTFFISKPEILKLLVKVYAGLRPGGIFAANFLGEHDAWATRGNAKPRHTWFSEIEMHALKRRFNSIYFEEKRGPAKLASGVAHEQHLWNFAFRK